MGPTRLRETEIQKYRDTYQVGRGGTPYRDVGGPPRDVEGKWYVYLE